MRTLFGSLTFSLLILAAPFRAAAPDWHLVATVAESCSCTISCPCNFGGDPNRNPCEGNRLIAIRSRHYEGVDLANVSFLVTFTMRSWSKIYVSDKVSDQRFDGHAPNHNRAFACLFPRPNYTPRVAFRRRDTGFLEVCGLCLDRFDAS